MLTLTFASNLHTEAASLDVDSLTGDVFVSNAYTDDAVVTYECGVADTFHQVYVEVEVTCRKVKVFNSGLFSSRHFRYDVSEDVARGSVVATVSDCRVWTPQ